MRDELAADTTVIHYRSMFQAAWEELPSFHAILQAKCVRVEDGKVYYTDKNGELKSVCADTVVVSAGMKAHTDEALEYFGVAPEFYMVGDCRQPATIQQAMRSAFSTASRI